MLNPDAPRVWIAPQTPEWAITEASKMEATREIQANINTNPEGFRSKMVLLHQRQIVEKAFNGENILQEEAFYAGWHPRVKDARLVFATSGNDTFRATYYKASVTGVGIPQD